jgi:hypothetical protein
MTAIGQFTPGPFTQSVSAGTTISALLYLHHLLE